MSISGELLSKRSLDSAQDLDFRLGIQTKLQTLTADLNFISRFLPKSHQYLTNVQSWNIRFGCETILTSHTKVYFNEFVANALCDNMGMIMFDL